MEDIKIWALDGEQVAPLKPAGRMESEQLLEETLVNNPGLLLEDLTLVGRQTPTEGGPLDLLGIDGDGRLVVFELKRGTLSRDAVAQVIDYASDLDRMDLPDLANHISERSGEHGIDKIEDFQDWYSNRGFGELESLKPLRMFLVGLGTDDTTERMVKFLSNNSGMDISLLTFHGFDYDGNTILAKRVEVDGAEVLSPKPKKPSLSREERRKLLFDLAESFGVRETFSDIRNLFLNNWNNSSDRITRKYASMLLRRVWYALIIPENGRVRIAFYPWTIELCRDAFSQNTAEIPYETHKGRYGNEIHFLIVPDEWEINEGKLTALIRAVYEAWKNKDRDDESDSA